MSNFNNSFLRILKTWLHFISNYYEVSIKLSNFENYYKKKL